MSSVTKDGEVASLAWRYKNLGSDVNHIIFGTIPLYTCSILIQVVYFEVNLVTRLVILSVTREIQHEQGRQLNLSSF